MLKEMLNVMAPMRDGVRLACNIFRPDDTKPYPAILLRTPYIKEKIHREYLYSNYRDMALSGYNMVFQDVRGTGASEGILDATGANESQDGYDSVEWLAAQPWCNGNVGMQGLSYFGFTQMAAAENNPPHLKALCPFQNSAVQPFSLTKAMTFDNYHLAWLMDRALENQEAWFRDPDEREKIKGAIAYYKENWNDLMFKLPLYDTPAARIEGVPQLKVYLELINGVEDPAFMQRAGRPVRVENINAPMFFLTGWFDGARDGTLDNWCRAEEGNMPQNGRKLIIGPWLHGGGLASKIDGRDFGAVNSGEGTGIRQIVKKWFDYWLKDEQNGIMDQSPVQIFVLGDNLWRGEQEWPLSRARKTRLYIHGGPDKNSGSLNEAAPGDEAFQAYMYDPENPLPSGIRDEEGRTIFADPSFQHEREDVLVYTGNPLDKEMEVTGPVEFVLYASTDAQDTDFFCRLCDIDETGYAFPLLSGIVRGKFREGTMPALLEPGRIYPFHIDLGSISVVFKKGHRIRIDISSSFYPCHNRSLNTAERIGHGTYSVKANQKIYHDSAHPSHLLLPVIPRE